MTLVCHFEGSGRDSILHVHMEVYAKGKIQVIKKYAIYEGPSLLQKCYNKLDIYV